MCLVFDVYTLNDVCGSKEPTTADSTRLRRTHFKARFFLLVGLGGIGSNALSLGVLPARTNKLWRLARTVVGYSMSQPQSTTKTRKNLRKHNRRSTARRSKVRWARKIP